MRQFARLSEIVSDMIPHSLLRGLKRARRFLQSPSNHLALSQAQLSSILSWFAMDTDAAIAIMDRTAVVLWVNPAFTRLTGFEFSEVVGRRFSRLQHGPETDPETLEVIRKAYLAGEALNVQIINYTKEGKAYWADIETRPIRSDSGEIEYFLSNQKDVTAARTQNEQLRQAKLAAEQMARDLSAGRQQLRLAADAGGLSLWDWDLKGDRFWISSNWIPVASDQWIEKCGLRDLFTLAHEEDFPRIEVTINKLLSPGTNVINEQFRMLIAGKWRWVNFRGSVSARDDAGWPTRVSGTLLDETDRKNSEERAQADRELLQCVIEHIPQAVFWKDAQRRYLGCNGRFAQTLGLKSCQDVVGKTDEELYADPIEGQSVSADDQEIVTSGKEVIAQQRSVRLADGASREILTSKVPLRAPDGQVFGMLGIFGDITEQRRLERQLADARQLESIGRLAAGVAHEINTPMQYISDNVEFLSESTSQVFELIETVQEQIAQLNESPQTRAGLPMSKLRRCDQKFDFIREQVPRAIKDCLVGSRRVMEIVSAMKVFSHPGTKSFVSANVNDLILSTTSITRNRWKYCATVELDLAQDLPTIRCLPSEINQVILNLLVNAADAVADRYGTDEVQGLITVVTRRAPGGVSIEVTDNGCGIPEAIQSKIFNPFFTTKGVGKGTGQGLTLCYAVVCKKHGGSLTLESQLNQGTTFRVFLPDVPCPVVETSDESQMPAQDCLC